MIGAVVLVGCQAVSAASPSPMASRVLPRFQPGIISLAICWALLVMEPEASMVPSACVTVTVAVSEPAVTVTVAVRL